MIRFLQTSGGGFQPNLPIAPDAVEGINWITVFIAENGGRKSFLLRCLTEAALGNHRYVVPKAGRVALSPPPQLPSRVIAISGTPLDRFPRAGTRDLRSKRRSTYEGNFIYLGQRASNGMSGLAQSERSLVGSLLSNRHRLKDRSLQLSRVFKHLGLEPIVSVRLRASGLKDPTSRLLDSEFLSSVVESARWEDSDSLESKELLWAIDQLANEKVLDTIRNSLEMIATGRNVLTITPLRTTPRFGLSVAMWELLLRAGAVELVSTEFRRARRADIDAVNGDQLSSGQWQWLGSFGALIAELRNNSLILVDEPENSLHPSWQRAFMSELHSSLAAFHGCQAIVATHSPLIASGVSPHWGNIRTLKRAKRVDGLVRSEPLSTAFGWNATDVYDVLFGMDSTRDPEFLSVANTALKRIANNEEIVSDEIDSWSDSLRLAIETLPPFDPMREIFADIVKTLQKRNVSSKRRVPARS